MRDQTAKTPSTFNAGLQELSATIASQLKLSQEHQDLLRKHLDEPEQEGLAAKALGSSNIPFSLQVNNGVGSTTTEKKTTFGVTLKGYFQITAPSNGTWDITVTDIAQKRVVLSQNGVACNQQVSFTYKTGFTCQMQITARWSTGGSTVLQGNVNVSY
jgi:hypothetical protein